MLAVLAGKREREVLAGRIGRARANFPVRRFHAVVADQVDDAAAALLDHDREHVAQAAHIAHEFELQALFPIVLGQMLDDAAGGRAGVVDHDIDAAERLVALLDEGLRIGVLAQIGGDGDDLAAGRLAQSPWRRLPAAPCGARRWRRQRPPSPAPCNALADALAAAGHQRRLALKFQVHRWFLPGVPFVAYWALSGRSSGRGFAARRSLRPACRMSRLSRNGVIGSSVTASGRAERIVDRRGDRGADRIDAALAGALQSQRIERARRVLA